MAFSSALLRTVPNHVGDRKRTFGTFTNTAGSIGGNIDTGLRVCENIVLQEGGSAVTTGRSVVNETLPVSGDAVTIVTDADVDGFWVAEGF